MRYNRAYIKKVLENRLPRLEEDERIYLNVDYIARGFAKYAHCGFDKDKKLWFTGSHNSNLQALIELYGINKITSEKALASIPNFE